ncbi:MAG: hypothetical protein K2L70_08910 [Clostridia bacterium]|nr:hypothetical protein [Clostridia bacterium]
MKKKKLVIFLLIAVMVLSLAVTALVGCKPEDDPNAPPAGYKKMTTSLSSLMGDALFNSSNGNKINNLKASAQLKVNTQYGDSTKEYLVKFGANVALNTADKNETNFGLSIVDVKANNANILNVYYIETLATPETDKLGIGDLYVDLGSGDSAQHFAIKGLSIKSVLIDQNKNVSDKDAEDIDNKIQDFLGDKVFNILDTVASVGNLYQSNDNSEVLLRLDLNSVFEKAGSLLDGLKIIDDYTEKLGLTLKSSDLKTLLPALTIDVSIKLKGAGNDKFEDAEFTGIEAKLGVPKKDIKVTRIDGTDFVHVNIDKDCKIGLGLDFAFGNSAGNAPGPLADFSAYKAISAINFTAAGELELNEAIGVNINLNGNNIPLEIPTGKYTIELAADLDPTQLIGINFNAKKTSEILNLVETIATRVINVISIKIVSTEDPSLKLDASIKDGNVYLTDLSLIGELGNSISAIISNGMSISGVINAIKPLLPADKEDPEVGSGDVSGDASGDVSGDASGSTPSGDDKKDDEVDWDALAALVKNLTLIVNDGTISVDVQNHTVAQNIKYKTEVKVNDDGTSGEVLVLENGKPVVDKNYGDTTLNVKAEANKNGIKINASLLNIILNQEQERKANVAAEIEVNSNGITIKAKSAAKLSDAAAEIDFGSGIKMKIDLVLKLTEFKYGNCAR